MSTFPYQCPFCGHYSTVSGNNFAVNSSNFGRGNKYGIQSVCWTATSCPNPKCGEYSFKIQISDDESFGKVRHSWELVPPAKMKVLPSYVPDAIREDYGEACLIAALSPKASATLARRCLQGMIRDFWGISKDRLVDEVKALKEKVDELTWNAIDAVRSIGNIGAHMEKDINVIVDVESNEAQLLISLIENLIDEWYVARHDREERFEKLVSTASDKKAQKAPTTNSTDHVVSENTSGARKLES